jgi:acetyl-CoA acetyltransferase
MGRSKTGRRLGVHPLRLTVDSCRAAVEDAGLTFQDIDGLVTWPGNTHGLFGYGGPGVDQMQDVLRLRLKWRASGNEGLNLLGTVVEAGLAVASGIARHVLVYRTVTEATVWKVPTPAALDELPTTLHRPYGARAVNFAAMMAHRYLWTYGYDAECLSAIALNQRRMAAENELAIYRTPLTVAEYLAAPVISDPLRRFDCDVPADGSFAFVVSERQFAADARHGTVAIEAAGAARTVRPRWEQMVVDGRSAPFAAARDLWSQTDVSPTDVDVAQLYDGFSIFMVQWLEALGLAGPGEGLALVQEAGRPGAAPRPPLNTSGGQLSEGRFIGFGLLYEACLQLRGQAGTRQIDDADVALVSSGGGAHGTTLLLTRRR